MKPDIPLFRRDPLAFLAALTIPSAQGPRPFASIMADFQREWFAEVAPAMLAFAARKQPRIGRFWCERTKGASKDSDLAAVLVWLLVFSRWGFSGQIGAADRDQANEVRKAIGDLLRLNPWLASFVTADKYALSNTSTGSIVDIVPADVAGSHGSRPDVLILNELSHIAGDDGQEFAANLLDNASKRECGLVFVASNAGYLATWQADWRAMALASDRWDFSRVDYPAPWLSAAELSEAQRRNSPKRFARLFRGAWVAGIGDALEESWIARSIRPDLSPMRGNEPGYTFVAGLDLGTKRDRSALVVLGYCPAARRVRLAFCRAWAPGLSGEVDLLAVERGVLDAQQRFHLAALVYDPSQAAHMVQALRRLHGVYTVEQPFAGQHLNRMAECLLQVFADDEVDLYQHDSDFSEDLILDLHKLSIEEARFGYRLTAVRDATGHADLAIALSIALPYAKRFTSAGSWSESCQPERMVVPSRHLAGPGMAHPYGGPVALQRPRDWNQPPSQPTGHDGRGSFLY